MIIIDDNTNMQSIKLYIQFARKLLKNFSEWAKESIPKIYIPRIIFYEEGYRDTTEEVFDYHKVLLSHFDEVLEMNEAVECAKEHIKENIIKINDSMWVYEEVKRHVLSQLQNDEQIYNFEENQSLRESILIKATINYLSRPVKEVLWNLKTYNPTDTEIIDEYTKEKDKWINNLVKVEVTIPLINFDADFDFEQIGEYLSLSRLSPQEKTDLWNRHQYIRERISFLSFYNAKYKLYGEYSFEKNGTRPVPAWQIKDDANCFVKALRIFKPGNVSEMAVFEKASPGYFLPLSEVVTAQYELNYRINEWGEKYFLLKEEVPQVIDLINTLQNENKKNSLKGIEVAMRRFNSAYNRDFAEDKIIDLTVALESCLLSNEQELSYKFSLRGTSLLADVRVDLEQTKLLLDLMYNIRSKIVHQGAILNDLPKDICKKINLLQPPVRPNQIHHNFEEIVRDALKIYIQHLTKGEDIEAIRKSLDNRIIASLKSGKI